MQTKLITYFNIKGGIYKTYMSVITAYELAKNEKISLQPAREKALARWYMKNHY